jgi:DNA-binding GntR family transcriptional regulator
MEVLRPQMNRIEVGRPRASASRSASVPPARRDVDAKQPVYLMIVDTLSERISTGVYAPGTRLPSSPQLCAEFGVSPMTVRRALTTLKDQGQISCFQGRGSFVRSPDLSRSTFKLASLSGQWLDGSAEIRLLSVAMTRADGKTATMLGITEGQRVVCLRRLVTSNAEPTMYHSEYVVYDPRRPLLESQLQLTSLHAFLESDRGKRFPRGELTVRAMNLDRDSAEALGEPEGAAALCLEHLFRDVAGNPVSWGYFLLRAELFQLSAQLESA